MRDHGARADDGAMTDCHSRRDRSCGADPDIVFNDDGGMRYEVVPLTRLDGMTGGAQSHSGTDQDAITDGDPSKIEEEAALIDEHTLSERCPKTVVAVERRQDGQ